MSERSFVIGLHGGWGIRFFMLGAAKIFARRHNRALRVYWDNDFRCPCPPSFKIDLVSHSEWQSLIVQRPGLGAWNDFQTTWTNESGASETETLALSAAWVPYELLGITIEEAVQEVRDWLDFSPFKEPALLPGTVGVHIRRTQKITDYVAVPEIPTAWVKDEMRKYPRGTPFFVCSDSKNEIEALLEKFPVLQTSGLRVGRLSAKSLINDLKEMLLLSSCRHIIGSISSFSHFAAMYGDSNLILDRQVSLPWWS